MRQSFPLSDSPEARTHASPAHTTRATLTDISPAPATQRQLLGHVDLPIRLSVCAFARLRVCPFARLRVCAFTRLPVCLRARLRARLKHLRLDAQMVLAEQPGASSRPARRWGGVVCAPPVHLAGLATRAGQAKARLARIVPRVGFVSRRR